MEWNDHHKLVGQHAYLGATQFRWLNYSDKKLVDIYNSRMNVLRGTELHELAAKAIKLRERFPKTESTLPRYVNDAIGFGMTPEQILYYSENCFGTADAIMFRDGMLRIHDLKTGTVPAHMEQLMIYAALFCLEYHQNPEEIAIELRIYQNNMVNAYVPSGEEIRTIMNRIIHADEIVRKCKKGEIM